MIPALAGTSRMPYPKFLLFNAAGGKGIGDFGLWSILVAFVGACALLFIMQAAGVTDRRR